MFNKFNFALAMMLVAFTILASTVFVSAQDDVPDQFPDEVTVTEVDCMLENGEASTCYQIVSIAIPNFDIGPFCPETTDDVGGIWDWDGENAGVYRLNGDFFEYLDSLGYNFVNADGTINVLGGTQQPASGSNYCLQMPEDTTVTMTSLIPTQPVMAETITELGTVAKVGVAIDGVPIFADAPSVLDTGNLPALDTCGGHVDPGGWYHWHATASDIDSSYEHEGIEDTHCDLEQSASELFGYAFDGFAIYGSAEPDGHLPTDLDECNGHVGEVPGSDEDVYHYHATLDFPNLPPCLVGVVAVDNFMTTASAGIGSQNFRGGASGPPIGGQNGQNGQQPDFAAAAAQLGITQQALMEALGDERPPDFARAAEILGITERELMDALGVPGR